MLREKNVGHNRAFLIIGIIFIALNLRPAITSVGPLVDAIRSDMNISNGLAGMLTTLPLLAFAALSIMAPKMASRIGNEWALFVGLVILIIGIILRSMALISPLFLGTLFVGLGIAICNVLLPSVVKQGYPQHSGLLTGVYTTAMGSCAALGSGLSIPLSEGLHIGWQKTLLLWGILVLIALVIWIPQLRRSKKEVTHQEADISSIPLWRSALAWQVTAFMGLQSFLFYCSIAWFPEILHSDGMSLGMSGWMVSLMQVVSLPVTFLTPVLAERLSHQKNIVLAIGTCYIIGILGLLVTKNIFVVVICVMLIGLAQGSSISLALGLLSLRTRTARQAAALSGLSQSFGYLLASVGPFTIGILYDALHSWTIPLVILMVAGIVMTVMGSLAGRDLYVLPDADVNR